ncbi:sn-glycerol-3-phosphate ABC transporter ATP-binding protein UgpC [Tissierella sp. MB52-C2]|uniref:ABC transporter ATP-binding protein n=1 Tax=Tissierella sp. MB52-C2 TaxID=3070999 RepID=UPI00280B8BB2|nr:sn-glycerol-3-phosphate ABC transporter ATP-binding protein UgpC [Tissierella sp. MB52-C2]WMM26357.1 sn-glycerol-3-phosphate ABC transporter ATP-binding protein UgpC [Tissierella sp. MB52-C2]
MKLQLKNISKTYENGFTAVKDFNLNVEDKEFIVFVGPSGCGKTTTLRMIAGLEEITSGELKIDGEIMNNVLSKNRNIAMIFQNYALYPHMSVYDNIAFGMKIRKLPKSEIDHKVKEAANILNIYDLLDRKPKTLSGGQRQRVAMGRAIVREPKIFLMDEPLSNLDAKLRIQMRAEIAKLYHRLQATIIYVTHDQTEAMTLGTRIVVMKEGVIQQVDTPKGLYSHPKNIFVAGFIDTQINFIDAIVKKINDKIYLHFNGIDIISPESIENVMEHYVDKTVIVGLHPEAIQICQNSTKYAKVDVVEHLGSEDNLYLDLSGMSINAKVSSELNIKVGDNVKISIDTKQMHVFDKTTELAIC